MSNRAVALHWAAKGCHIFPAKWQDGRHFGLIKWSTESTCDAEIIKAWFDKWPGAYPCINLGQSRLCVLDVDDKSGNCGPDSLLALELDGLELPAGTPSNPTPSGKGRHYWFKGALKNSAGVLGVGLDTRGMGGMVPCPGATVPGKGTYGALPDTAVPKQVPQWIVDRVGLPNRKTDRNEEPAASPDSEAQFLRATAWIREHAPKPEIGERNDAAYKVAARLRDFGLSENAAYTLADTAWNAALESPLSGDELRDVVSHAYEYALGRQGADTAEAAGFTNVEPEPENRIIYIADFLSTPAPPREWIIKDWLPLGSANPTLVTGDGGTGKSTIFGIQLAMSVANGVPWLGEEVARSLPSLWVMCEDDEDEIHRRVEEVRKASPDLWEDLKLNRRVGFLPQVGRNSVICYIRNGALVDGPFFEELDRQMSMVIWRGQPFILGLDTVADIHGANESDRAAINQLIKNKICALCMKHGATPILVAHPPKSGETYSGSTAWNNAVRNRLYLAYYDPGHPGPLRVLTREKCNYAAADDRKILRYDRGVYREVGEVEILGAMADNVLRAIRDAAAMDVPLSRAPQSASYFGKVEILTAEGKPIPKHILQASINKLLSDGKVVEEKQGRKAVLLPGN